MSELSVVLTPSLGREQAIQRFPFRALFICAARATAA